MSKTESVLISNNRNEDLEERIKDLLVSEIYDMPVLKEDELSFDE